MLELLGRGSHRAVYALSEIEALKVDVVPRGNVIEWDIWQLIKDTGHSRFFMPISAISADGTVMKVQRCECPASVCVPPILRDVAELKDLKNAVNYGRNVVTGEIVLVDYGSRVWLQHIRQKLGLA